MRLSRFCSGVAAMLLAPSAAANAAPVPSQLAKMDAEGFRSTTTVDDDDLEFSTIISTRDSFRKERRVNGSTWADGHVEAHIDKRTGDIRFEVHQSLRYRGSQRQYDVVHFEDRDGRGITGVIVRINQRTATIGIGDGGTWRVPFHMLRHVLDI